MTINLRDPLRGALLGRGIVHGDKTIGCPYLPITPEERDLIIQRLTHEQQDMICTGCGSTKPISYFKAVGAISCCDARNMVPAAGVIHELTSLKSGPVKREPGKRQKWIAAEIEAGRGVNRQTIMKQFGIGRSAASADISKFMGDNPEAVIYDASAKVHRQKVAA
jgi:hypothetical protein